MTDRTLTPGEAMERWLKKQRVDLKESTLSTYHYRLKLIVDYCRDHGIETMSELEPWDVDEFDAERRAREPTKVSLEKEYRTINDFLEWAEAVGLAQEGVADILKPPETSKDEQVSQERLDPRTAQRNLAAFRRQPLGDSRASIEHALLEVMWSTGARMSAILGLDIEDFDRQRGTLRFHQRDTGPDIKVAHNPERIVGLPPDVAEVLKEYVEHHRIDTLDDHGRQPLFTTHRGRPGTTTVRRYSYWASLPCHGSQCPHEKQPETCEWRKLREATHCPSSRGPHAVRTGAISYIRNSGWSPSETAERVNTSPQRIEQHYDFPTLEEQFSERRAADVDDLSLGVDADQNDDEEDSTHA